MKRMWIGAGLLAALLAGGLLSGRWMMRSHEPLSELLEQAAEAAMEEKWEQADSLLRQGELAWQQRRNAAAAFADHSPMEEIDESFAELVIFSRSREQVHFAATCLALSKKLEAMGDAHSLAWWNLL